ncbi:MAG: Flp pilus assembly complex ATPase component TadA [Actinomycetota bacterium]|nr:Flp pilus assembly complex ATPase component TadA [Actinomycetota bacterium]
MSSATARLNGEAVVGSVDDATSGELSPRERRGLVRRIADQVGSTVSSKVQAASDAGRPMSTEAEKVASSTEIQQAMRAENEARLRAGLEPFTFGAHEALVDQVMAHVYGLGELEVLWNHPDVENIDVNGPDEVWVTFVGGRKQRWAPIAETEADLLELIRRVARRLGLVEVDFDARHPQLDVQLPDGSRLAAVFGGTATNGLAPTPYLCIRRHRYLDLGADDLVGLGLWPQASCDFTVAWFRSGGNVIVAGDWNAGKTTALRGLCHSAIPPWHRVVTVEARITELGLHRSGRLPNVVALFSRPPGAEGEGEVTVQDLVSRTTRRLNPTRVIIGEVLGDEVGAVLDVFSGSTRGSACTIHASSARDTIQRFEQYGLAARPPMPPDAIRYALAQATPLIVHLAGDESTDGALRRYVTSIIEVTGLEDGHVAATELWGLDDSGELVPRHALSMAKRQRLATAGWDWLTDGWGPQLPVGAANGELR